MSNNNFFKFETNSAFDKTPLNIVKYFIYGVKTTLFIIGKLIKYFAYGFTFPVIISNMFKRQNHSDNVYVKENNKEQKLFQKEEQKFYKVFEQQEAQKQKLRSEGISEDDIEKILIEDETDIETKASNLITKISSLFNKPLFKSKKKEEENNEANLLLGLNNPQNQKNNVKLMYEYVAKAPDGKNVKGHFEAYSEQEVTSYLMSEGFEVYSVKTNRYIQLFHSNGSYSRVRIANKDLIFFLTQLSTYIKSGIPLVDSLKILSKQYKQYKYQKLFKSLIYALSTGESFSSALAKQGNAFPKILINMVRASEMTGELPETLDDMADYFSNIEKTRKQMVTAMMYPTIIMVFAFAVIAFILIWVIPRFVSIYESMEAEIPAFTQFILNASDFFQKYIYIILISFIVLVLVLKYLFDNIKAVRFFFQWLIMHFPVFSNIVIYNEVTIFTKTFASLLSHNVFITDSMEILDQITSNEVYRGIIKSTITNLAKGERISKSFENHWAFPVTAYEMLVTGEKTGQLPEMMQKVSEYYQELHSNSVSRVKTFMEPLLIVFLTVVVGAIVLAIIIPMFGMYSAIQDLD